MKFRKKPVEVEAVQYTGHNLYELAKFAPHKIENRGSHAVIETLEGVMRAEIGDWIIRGVKGEFYPCKPDIFDMTYELVAEGK